MGCGGSKSKFGGGSDKQNNLSDKNKLKRRSEKAPEISSAKGL